MNEMDHFKFISIQKRLSQDALEYLEAADTARQSANDIAEEFDYRQSKPVHCPYFRYPQSAEILEVRLHLEELQFKAAMEGYRKTMIESFDLSSNYNAEQALTSKKVTA